MKDKLGYYKLSRNQGWLGQVVVSSGSGCNDKP